MSNTLWSGSQANKLYLQSGQFSSTLKTSLDVSSVEAAVQDISWDGVNTLFTGSVDDKLYLQSGQFSSTLKTSLTVTGGASTNPRGISADSNGDTLWCSDATDKLYLQSGQFSSTIKNSLNVSGIDTDVHGISFDGTNSPWAGIQGDKLYLQSGEFSSTLKTSVSITSIDNIPVGISYDGQNTPWCGTESEKLYLQSGQFSSTLKTSLDVSGVDSSVTGIEDDDFNARLGLATELIGSLASSSNLTGSLLVATELIGSLASSSNLTGSLLVATELIGSLASSSNLTGSLLVATELIGSLASNSSLTGDLSGIGNLTGSLASSSSLSGSLLVATELIGSLTSSSGITGSLSGIGDLIGILSSSSNLTGSLSITIGLTGSLASSSSLIGSLTVGILEISGSLSSSSNLTGELISYFDSRNNLNATSLINGFLDVIPDFEAITLFWRPQKDIVETLEWLTEVLKSRDGTEQRIKVRQSPRQHFKLSILLENNKHNSWYDNIIHTWQKSTWLIPVWTEYVEHSGDINHHDTFITVDTTNADFRNGSKAIIWKSETEYEVIVIDTVEDNKLNLHYTILNSFTGLKYIIPVRVAYMTSHSAKQRYNSEFSLVDVIFAIYDNTIISGYVPEYDYDGFPILNIPSYMENTHNENSDGDIIIIDFETGKFEIKSHSDFNILSQDHIFFNDTKLECWSFRKLLHFLSGQQKSILIPTFRNDVIQTSNINALDVSFEIEHINLSDYLGVNNLRKYIGFYFSDGSLIVRRIINIEEIDSSTEKITFDANLGLSTILIPGDCKICFVDKCRLTSDKVELNWPYAHRNECSLNFTRVR